MKLTRSRFSTAAGLIIASLCGCDIVTRDGIANGDYPGRYLTTLHGSVRAEALPPEWSLKLAVLWDAAEPECTFTSSLRFADCSTFPRTVESVQTRINAYADSPSEAYFEAGTVDFAVPISNLPPTGALVDLTAFGGQGVAASGRVVVYFDGDGDGKLALARPGVASPDVVAGMSDERVEYLDGEYGDFKDPVVRTKPYPATMQQGFNVMKRGFVDTSSSTDEYFQWGVLPENGPITLELAKGDRQLESLAWHACGQTTFIISVGGTPPADATMTCFHGGEPLEGQRKGLWFSSAASDDACVSGHLSGTVCVPQDEPIPADWNCVQ